MLETALVVVRHVEDEELVEVDREIKDYIRLGIGYDFSDFDDDLRSLNSFTRHGFFTRVSGKF